MSGLALSRLAFQLDISNHVFASLRRKMYAQPDVMRKCWVVMNRILEKYPPKKNENKFVYGKCCEEILMRCMNEFEPCVSLDDEMKQGACYKNDCLFPNIDILLSIKCSKSGGSIILINKHTKSTHNIEGLRFAIVHFEHRRIYMFTHSPEYEKFVKDSGSNVKYKSSIFTHLKQNPQNYYEFPSHFDKYLRPAEEEYIFKDIVSRELDDYHKKL